MRRARIPALAACVAVVLLCVAPTVAGAADQRAVAGGRALSTDRPVLTFSGAFENPTPLPMISDPDPTVCAIDCQEWLLNVQTTAPFLVSIKNPTGSIEDGLNLYVDDPSGQQVGSSEGVGSNGQAVAVHPSTNGRYRVIVTVTYQYDQKVRYLGEARLMASPSWTTPGCSSCELLPRLKPMPPTDFHVDGIPPAASTPLGFPFPFDIPTGNSCYTDETASTGALRCLRFTSSVRNVGSGNLRLQLPWIAPGASGAQSGFVPGGCEATQVVDRTRGAPVTRSAGPCLYHPQHAHFHYRNFVSFDLYRVNGGAISKRPTAHLRSLKESFCLADDDYFGFGTPGPNGPRNYSGQPGCNFPATADEHGAWVEMGMTPGWADVYTWDTPSQYIDITNVSPGVYDVVTKTNPSGDLLVAGPKHICARTRIKLTASSVKVIGSDADAPCP
jgi:hypothetical protein